MKYFFTVIVIAVSSLASAATKPLSMVCQGNNKAGQAVSFLILQDSSNVLSASLYANTQSAGISVRPVSRLNWTAIEGCVGVTLAGLKGSILNDSLAGNLYVECDADGDYGWVKLQKTGQKTYKGSIQSQDGIPSLRMKDEEKVSVSCSIN